MPTDAELTQKLIDKYGKHRPHPLYSKLDWRYAVCNGTTLEGYWPWVLAQLKAELAKRQPKGE